MKGYVITDDVLAYMGLASFTIAQTAIAELEIGAAEEWIDNELGFAWLESGAKTKTFYNPQSPFITLPAPITTVDGVVIHSAPYGCEPITLVADQQYWLQDASIGKLYVPWAPHVYKIVVDYTPDAGAAVPDSIKLATMAIVASNLFVTAAFTNGVDPNLIQSYTVGGELQVQFRKDIGNSGGSAIPQKAMDYLDKWRKGFVIV